MKSYKKKSKKLGATSLGYSNRVNNKYVVDYDGEKIHFGSIKIDDFLINGDEKKKKKEKNILKELRKSKIKMMTIPIKYQDMLIIGM